MLSMSLALSRTIDYTACVCVCELVLSRPVARDYQQPETRQYSGHCSYPRRSIIMNSRELCRGERSEALASEFTHKLQSHYEIVCVNSDHIRFGNRLRIPSTCQLRNHKDTWAGTSLFAFRYFRTKWRQPRTRKRTLSSVFNVTILASPCHSTKRFRPHLTGGRAKSLAGGVLFNIPPHPPMTSPTMTSVLPTDPSASSMPNPAIAAGVRGCCGTFSTPAAKCSAQYERQSKRKRRSSCVSAS